MKRRLTVLIVENDPELRDAIEQMVESWMEVDCLLANGFQGAATWIAAAPKIDLLVCDVEVPGVMSGIKLAEIAVRTFPNIAVVMMFEHDRAYLTGTADRYCFLPKPFDRQTLVAHIENACSGPESSILRA
jgi:DNA-binding NtrC family response regulator